MKKIIVAVFSSKSYDRTSLLNVAPKHIRFQFIDVRLNEYSVNLAQGADIVCVFVNDILNRSTLTQLHSMNIDKIVMRCAGFNNLDVEAAKELNIKVARVPGYSPEAVAEHAISLILTLNRKLHKAYNRVKEDNFSLSGLLGFNIHGKTVGLIGTGQIGLATARILVGFGATVIAYDPVHSNPFEKLGGQYVSLTELYKRSDIISLHCPLVTSNHHLINATAIDSMKDNVMLINTSRGGLIDTQCLINYLKNGKIGYLGLDVYEQESDLFFDDHSQDIIQDDLFQRLLTFPNVVITGHQGFFTQEALSQIALTSITNINELAQEKFCSNLISTT